MMSDHVLSHEKAADIGQTISALRARFIKHDQYFDLAQQFDLLLYRRRADLAAQRQPEARGIVLIGNPGSGKSTAIQRLLSRHPDLQVLQPNNVAADVVSLMIPSPATLKSVGLSCLKGLGYPLRRDRTAAIIWDLVQAHLEQRQVLFLHLDEMQDLYVNRSQSETQAVVNTLKSLMQSTRWPVGLILSGTSELRELVNIDPQLARRLIPIEFAPIRAVTHSDSVIAIIREYAGLAALEIHAEVKKQDHIRRLIHAAADELGLTIEMIISAIEEALLHGEEQLTAAAFRRAYRRKAGCSDVLNPFVAADWQSIDTRKLFNADEPNVLGSNSVARR